MGGEEYIDQDAEIAFLCLRLETLMAKKLDRVPISSPMDVKRLLIGRLAGREDEEFHALFLDNRHRIIAIEALFRGTLDSCSTPIAPILRAALKHKASACILAHQHPAGSGEPSMADRKLTLMIKESLSLIDIRLLDHMIVHGAEVTSMTERGLI
ncbi:MAG: hypothetical protein DDT25_00604 [Chloroflexi bacterium]|nr:hypothetical protein [Chloroflexota bacterium]